ncbi:hypothetical protein J2W49_001964 [Hydrogenophaga palleronii]|uniref:Pnap3591-like protein n=1 Tax=Hydrogenophaga palleronii TaxID=65655 RepID=A0ABU1WLT9_9BURK|nr:hypothetical protein [Hydrogenophaga palleronii]MDR7150009.1 hypothetical protein [Hydrogenophaga palleronii]
MKATALGLLLSALALLATAPAGANPQRLDDSLSHTVPPNVQMQWLPIPRDLRGTAAMEAWVTVNIRIDTSEWVGRSGRVYMVLSRDEVSPVEAVWTTQGRLQAGRVVSGERALVYAGVLRGATLEDQMQVRLRSNADWQSQTRRLNFHFEFDAD